MTTDTDGDPYVGRRLQLSRRRGWRLPARARSVARPTRWANPFRPARRSLAANARAVEEYREHLARHPRLVAQARLELSGFDLACWCPPDLPCHADVLLEIVAEKGSAAPDLPVRERLASGREVRTSTTHDRPFPRQGGG